MLLRLRYRLARLLWPEGHRGLDAANDPDLPDVADRWVILDRGRWGTLGATRVGFGRIFVGIFKGYGQVSKGILLTPTSLETLRAMMDECKPLFRSEFKS